MRGRSRNRLAVVAGILALGLAAAACGGDSGSSGNGGGGEPAGLTGTITVSGSSTVEPITSLVAELFGQANPDVQVSVSGPGTSDGFVLFCDGETDIQDASRPIDPEEAKVCEKNGVGYTELEVALDGITVMTSPGNTAVTCLTNGDLYGLFGPESEGFATWSDAEGLAADVGGTGGFPNAALEITAPGEESGTYDAFIELSGIADIGVERGLSETKAEALRQDYQPSPNDNVIIQAMEGSSSALGFVGYAFAAEAGDQVKPIEIDGGEGCVPPDYGTISDGSYPLSRSLYIYVNNEKLAQSEALKAFVDLYVSDDGLALSVKETGYIQLPPERIEATRSTWETASVA